MVTTPQEVALADVRRSIDLFKKYNMRILGSGGKYVLFFLRAYRKTD